MPLITPDTNSEEWRIVKAADRLCAYIKCLEEAKAGNAEFREAQTGIEASIYDIDLPLVQYFMREFIPGFTMTLYQISR